MTPDGDVYCGVLGRQANLNSYSMAFMDWSFKSMSKRYGDLRTSNIGDWSLLELGPDNAK